MLWRYLTTALETLPEKFWNKETGLSFNIQVWLIRTKIQLPGRRFPKLFYMTRAIFFPSFLSTPKTGIGICRMQYTQSFHSLVPPLTTLKLTGIKISWGNGFSSGKEFVQVSTTIQLMSEGGGIRHEPVFLLPVVAFDFSGCRVQTWARFGSNSLNSAKFKCFTQTYKGLGALSIRVFTAIHSSTPQELLSGTHVKYMSGSLQVDHVWPMNRKQSIHLKNWGVLAIPRPLRTLRILQFLSLKDVFLQLLP